MSANKNSQSPLNSKSFTMTARIFSHCLDLPSPFSIQYLAESIHINIDMVANTLMHLRMLGLLQRVWNGDSWGLGVSPWVKTRSQPLLEYLCASTTALWTPEDRECIRSVIHRCLLQAPYILRVYAGEGSVVGRYDFGGIFNIYEEPGWVSDPLELPLPAVLNDDAAIVREVVDAVTQSAGLRSIDYTFIDHKGRFKHVLEQRPSGHFRFHPVDKFTGLLPVDSRTEPADQSKRQDIFREIEFRLGQTEKLRADWCVRATRGIASIDIFPAIRTKAMSRNILLCGEDLGIRNQVVSFGDRPNGNDAPLLQTPLPSPDDKYVFLSVDITPDSLNEIRCAGTIAPGISAGYLGPGCHAMDLFLTNLLEQNLNHKHPLDALLATLRSHPWTPDETGARDLISSIQQLWNKNQPVVLAFDLDHTIIEDQGSPIPIRIGWIMHQLNDFGYQLAIITGREINKINLSDTFKLIHLENSSSGKASRQKKLAPPEITPIPALTGQQYIEVMQKIDQEVKHCQIFPPPGDLGRREGSSLLDFFTDYPNLVTEDRLRHLVAYAISSNLDDNQYHAAMLVGDILREHGTSTHSNILTPVIDALQNPKAMRYACIILGRAVRDTNGWMSHQIMPLVSSGQISKPHQVLIDMERLEGVERLVSIRTYLHQSFADNAPNHRIDILERAVKLTRQSILFDPTVKRIFYELLDRDGGYPFQHVYWPMRALAADRAAFDKNTDLMEILLEGLLSDPEPEVRTRIRKAYATLAVQTDSPARISTTLEMLLAKFNLLDEDALRYFSGVIPDIIFMLPVQAPIITRSVEQLIGGLLILAREHQRPYTRKAAVKICAKLLPLELLPTAIEAALYHALEDTSTLVQEEALISLVKRAGTEKLNRNAMNTILWKISLKTADPPLLLTMARLFPQIFARVIQGKR